MHSLSLSLNELPQNASIAIYGTGKRGRDYYKIISTLRPDVKIVCFLNSFNDDPANNPPIVKIDKLKPIIESIDIVLVCSIYRDEICATLRQFDIFCSQKLSIFTTHWFEELLSAKELKNCENTFLELNAISSNFDFVCEALGEIALQKNSAELACEYFTLQTSKFPESIEGHIGHAKALIQMNKYEEALSTYKFLEDKFPDNIFGYIGHAMALDQMSKYEEALSIYKLLEEKFPNNINGYLGHAKALFQINNYNEALTLYKFIEDTFPEDIEGYIGYAKTLIQMNKQDEALAIYQMLDDKFPENINGYLGHAIALFYINKYEEALSIYIRIEKKFPDNVKAYLGHASILTQIDKYEEADAIYKNIVRDYPDNINICLNYSERLILLRKYDKAMSILLRIYRTNTFNSDLLVLLEIAAIALRKFSFAKQVRLKLKTNSTIPTGFKEKKPKKILFFHIYKCGGSTIDKYLRSNYKPCNIFSLKEPYDAHIEYFASLSNTERNGYDLITGHYSNCVIKFLDFNILKAVLFRDPVERTLSEYYFLSREPNSKANITNKSLYDFIRHSNNFYINYFSSEEERQTLPDHDLVSVCFLNIKNTFDVVGITEQLSAFATKLQATASLPFAYGGNRENVTYNRRKATEIDVEIIDLAKKRLALDIQLYNRIKQELAAKF